MCCCSIGALEVLTLFPPTQCPRQVSPHGSVTGSVLLDDSGLSVELLAGLLVKGAKIHFSNREPKTKRRASVSKQNLQVL